MMNPDLDVLVEKAVLRHAVVIEVCKIADLGFRCGCCDRGLLGLRPRVGQKCKVCGAKVIQTPAMLKHLRKGSR